MNNIGKKRTTTNQPATNDKRTKPRDKYVQKFGNFVLTPQENVSNSQATQPIKTTQTNINDKRNAPQDIDFNLKDVKKIKNSAQNQFKNSANPNDMFEEIKWISLTGNLTEIDTQANANQYKGGLDEHGLKSGYGVHTTKDHIIECRWYKDKPIGQIKVTYPNGDVFQGNVCNHPGADVIAKGNIRTSDNKIKYTGKICNYQIQGLGTFKLLDGSEVTGEWENNGNICHNANFANNQTAFSGRWEGGKPLCGKCNYPNKITYYGQLKFNLIKIDDKYTSVLLAHGEGCIGYPNECSYKGTFEDGYYFGKGRLKYPNHGQLVGTWANKYFFTGKFIAFNSNDPHIECENLFVPPPYFNLQELEYLVDHLPQNNTTLPSCLKPAYSHFYKDIFLHYYKDGIPDELLTQASTLHNLKKLFTHIINYPQAPITDHKIRRLKSFVNIINQQLQKLEKLQLARVDH